MAEGVDDDDDIHQDMHEGSNYRRIEVTTGRRKRRTWTVKEKAAIVSASAEPGANISDVARRFGVNRGLLSVWRRQAGLSSLGGEMASFVPITERIEEPHEGSQVGRTIASSDASGGRIELMAFGAADHGLVD